MHLLLSTSSGVKNVVTQLQTKAKIPLTVEIIKDHNWIKHVNLEYIPGPIYLYSLQLPYRIRIEKVTAEKIDIPIIDHVGQFSKHLRTAVVDGRCLFTKFLTLNNLHDITHGSTKKQTIKAISALLIKQLDMYNALAFIGRLPNNDYLLLCITPNASVKYPPLVKPELTINHGKEVLPLGGTKDILEAQSKIFSKLSTGKVGYLTNLKKASKLKDLVCKSLAASLNSSISIDHDSAYSKCDDVLKSWADSASSDISLAMQQEVNKLFKLKYSPSSQKALKSLPVFSREHESSTNYERALLKDSTGIVKAVAQAIYNNTQAFFKEKGIKSIVAYRGLIYNDPDLDKVEERIFLYNPLSSFSLSSLTAGEFALKDSPPKYALKYDWVELLTRNHDILKLQYDEDDFDAQLLVIHVPVEMVFSTPFTGIGCYTEQEVVIVGGELSTRIIPLIPMFGNISKKDIAVTCKKLLIPSLSSNSNTVLYADDNKNANWIQTLNKLHIEQFK